MFTLVAAIFLKTVPGRSRDVPVSRGSLLAFLRLLVIFQ